MGRNHLAHAAGDAANAVLAATGYNFRRLLAWLAVLLRQWIVALVDGGRSQNSSVSAQLAFFTGDSSADRSGAGSRSCADRDLYAANLPGRAP